MTYQDVNEQQKKAAGFDFDYGPLLDDLLLLLPSAPPLIVELGTYLGCSAAYLVSKMAPGTRLYSVDTFETYGNSQKFFASAVLNLKACGVRDAVHLLSCRSWEAAQFFDEKEVDMVWIDAGHDFISVKGDLDAWHSRVKPGGILAGHDLSEAAVKLAVERFCFAEKKEYHVYQPNGWMSWWIQM